MKRSSLTRDLARDYLAGNITRRYLLDIVSDLCLESDYRRELFPFYLLRHTLIDFDYGEFSFHRTDATKENFDDLLRTEIEGLLASEAQGLTRRWS
jgi:hypothetical protein